MLTALLEYEAKVENNQIKSFSLSIQGSGLMLKTDLNSSGVTLQLSHELYNSLNVFFFGINSISYPSFDYTTLKSLINAHFCIERIRSKKASGEF